MMLSATVNTKSFLTTANLHEEVSKSFGKAHDLSDGERWRSRSGLGEERADVKCDRHTSSKEQTGSSSTPLSDKKKREKQPNHNESTTAKLQKIRSVIESIRERRLQHVQEQEQEHREFWPSRRQIDTSRVQKEATNDDARNSTRSNNPEETSVPVISQKRKSRIIQQVRNHARFEQHLIEKMHDVNMLLSMAEPGTVEEERLVAEKQFINESKEWAQQALEENLHFLTSKTRTPRKASGDATSGSETKSSERLNPNQKEAERASFTGNLTQNLQNELDIMKKVVSKLLTEAKDLKSQNPTVYVLNKELEYTKEKIRIMELNNSQLLRDLERTKQNAEKARVEERSKLTKDLESSRTKIRDAEFKNQQLLRDLKASKSNPSFVESSSSTQRDQLDGETVKRSNKRRHKKPTNSRDGKRPTGLCSFSWQKLNPVDCDGASFPLCNYTDGEYRPAEALSRMSESCDRPLDDSNRYINEPDTRKYWDYRSRLRPLSTGSAV